MTDELRDVLAEAMMFVPGPAVMRSGSGTGAADEAIVWGELTVGPVTHVQRAEAILAALPPEAIQDWRDGRALRLLWEAMPKKHEAMRLGVVVKDHWCVVAVGWWDDEESWVHRRHEGADIAEAADKAREALA